VADARVYARSIGVASLLPLFRGESGRAGGGGTGEPWAMGPEAEQTVKFALHRRARLAPYLYTLFWESHRTGMPIVRPAFFADPGDPALRSEDDAFLLGSDLLVVPSVSPQGDRVPVLPKGIWNEVQLVEEGIHPDLPRLYVRGGAIVPIGSTLHYAGDRSTRDEHKAAPLTLVVSLNEGGSAEGKLYEDDGDGFGYINGDYAEATYVAHTVDGNVVVETTGQDGNWRHEQRDLRILLIRDGWYYSGVTTDGMRYTFLIKSMNPLHFPKERPAIPAAEHP
jgi:alpha-glucosidase